VREVGAPVDVRREDRIRPMLSCLAIRALEGERLDLAASQARESSLRRAPPPRSSTGADPPRAHGSDLHRIVVEVM
jgi:hypothetical protein